MPEVTPEATPLTAAAGTGPALAAGGDLLLDVRHLVQEFVLRDYGGAKGGVLQAVSDVSFELRAGETLGIVGETGSGKSTLARSVIQAPPPKQGAVIFQGQDLVGLSPRAMKPVRRELQMVFQDPFTSLDPKWTVSRIVGEPLTAYGLAGGCLILLGVLVLVREEQAASAVRAGAAAHTRAAVSPADRARSARSSAPDG